MLYFLPERRFDGGVPKTLAPEAYGPLGLGHVVDAGVSTRHCHNGGPDGGAGLVVGYGVPVAEIGVFRDKQSWTCCHGGDLWIGWASDAPPKPQDLVRPGVRDTAYGARLADGNWWGFTPTDRLPLVAGLDSVGQYSEHPRPEDEAHYEAAEWIYEWMGDATTPRNAQDIVDRLAACLAARYRVTLAECLALRLFDESNLIAAGYAALGARPATGGE